MSILPGQGATPLPSFEGEQLRQRAAAAELRAAATKYRGRVAAADVRSIVDGVTPSLTSRDVLVPKPSEVSRVLGPRAAQLRGADGKPGGAAVFGMPIAVPVAGDADEKWELADLDWQADAGRLTVARSAVPVSLPSVGSGQVRVGDLAARLAPAGATGSAANVENESVVYPNVATDTDLVVRSLSVGVQVGWVLRSPEADEAIRVPLELPAGLSARLDGQGGVRIVDSAGRLAGSWSASTAVDAGGFPVPLKTSLDGTTVVIRVSHRAAETQYPVVVDPYFEAGGTASTSDFNAWVFAKSDPSSSFHTNELTPPAARTSLFVGSGNGVSGWSTVLLENGAWGRPAPGDQTIGSPGAHGRNVSPEHAYWTDGTFSDVTVTTDELLRLPELFHRPKASLGFGLGIRYANFGGTHTPSGSSVQQYGPWIMTMGNGSGLAASVQASASVKQPGNWAVAGLYVNGKGDYPQPPATAITNPDDYGTLDMQSYRLNAQDDVVPTATSPAAGSVLDRAAWVDGSEPPSIAAADRGTGVAEISFYRYYGSFGYFSTPIAPTCPATGDVLCPFEAEASFPIDDVPEGRTFNGVMVRDGGGRSGAVGMPLAIDRTPPEIQLSGTLYTDRATEVAPGLPRPVTIAATDGDPSATTDTVGYAPGHRSGVQRIEVYVDDELVHEVEQTVTGDSTPLSTTWTPDAETFTSGEYTVEVAVTDRVGHESSETFTVKAPCCGVPLEDDTVDIANRVHAVGDVNGDGQADIVLVTQSTGGISVRLGQGDGTFAAASSWGSFGAAVDQIAVGEVDGESPDGPAETLTPPAGDDIVARLESGDLVTLLSDGETFTAESTTGMTDLQTTWPLAWTLGLADVDGDGADDVWGVDGASGELHIGYSYGPAFAETSPWSVIPPTRDVQLADLDGDGLADLVTYEPSDGVVRFHQSLGDGFAPTDTWGQGPEDADLQTADVNGDGLDDAIFRDTSPGAPDPAPVTARISSSNEGFVDGTRVLGTLSDSYTLYAADLTGEGREDVLGLRIQGTQLLVRSIGSNVPVTDELDLTEDDPDQDGEELLARAGSTNRKARLFMSDDNALRYGIGLDDPSLERRKDLLDRMKYLGATGVRTVAYWGKIDRLRPASPARAAIPAGPDGPGRPAVPARVADDTTMVLAPGQPPAKPDGSAGGTQSETNRPTTPRRFMLARDAAVAPESLAGTVDDPEPEWIDGEWRIVQNRFYTAEIDQMLRLLTEKKLDAHVTITGSNRDYFDCKDAEDHGRKPFGVRGCDMPDGVAVMTGLDPDPKRAGHAIASIAQYLHTTHRAPAIPATPDKPAVPERTTIKSIGVWNEPNLPSGAFLSRPNAAGKEQNTTALYGRIYAYTWENLRRRSLLSGTNRILVGFGEVSSAASTYGGHKATSGLHRLRPDQYVKRSLDAAKVAPGVAWPTGGPVRADFLAIHPYQHTTRPWSRSTRYPWGVRHVGAPLKYDKGRKTPLPSVKGFLAAHKSALFRKQGVTGATAPEIWATEFGYFSVKGRKKTTKKNKVVTVTYDSDNLKQAHGERERARFMTNNGGTRHGALRALSNAGNVKMIALWEVLEDPLPRIGPGLPEGSFDDYGFIGTGGVFGDPDGVAGPADLTHSYTRRAATGTTAWPGQARYQNQILKVTGTRVYGKAPSKPPTKFTGDATLKSLKKKRYNGLQWPQQRRVGCEIRKWSTPKAKCS